MCVAVLNKCGLLCARFMPGSVYRKAVSVAITGNAGVSLLFSITLMSVKSTHVFAKVGQQRAC